MQAKCVAVLPSAASRFGGHSGHGELDKGKAGKLPTLSKGFLMLTPSVVTLLMRFSTAGYCTPHSAFPVAIKQAGLFKIPWDTLSLSLC